LSYLSEIELSTDPILLPLSWSFRPLSMADFFISSVLVQSEAKEKRSREKGCNGEKAADRLQRPALW
jgi:hypothetical protein